MKKLLRKLIRGVATIFDVILFLSLMPQYCLSVLLGNGDDVSVERLLALVNDFTDKHPRIAEHLIP